VSASCCAHQLYFYRTSPTRRHVQSHAAAGKPCCLFGGPEVNAGNRVLITSGQ